MKSNRFWLLFIGSIVLLSVATLLILPLFQKEGAVVQIYLNGSQTPSYELPLQQDRTLLIPQTGTNYNTIVIENGTVRVSEASCPDQVCVRHAPISKTNDSIVCLPHRLVIQVYAPADSADGVDAVSQ